LEFSDRKPELAIEMPMVDDKRILFADIQLEDSIYARGIDGMNRQSLKQRIRENVYATFLFSLLLSKSLPAQKGEMQASQISYLFLGV